MLTFLDVVDDAVKIGLSALIGAIGSYLILRRTHAHELTRNFSKRRQDIIEQVSAAFEPIYALSRDSCRDYEKFLNTLKAEAAPSSEAIEKHRKIRGEMLDSFKTLQVLEGRLLLIGASHATGLLRHYRSISHEIHDVIRPEIHRVTVQELADLRQKLSDQRDVIYAELADLFRDLDRSKDSHKAKLT